MAIEKEVLRVASKDVDEITHADALDFMIKTKKSELDKLLSQISQYKTQLISLDSALIRQKSEFDAFVKEEKSKLEREKQSKLNEFINRDSAIQKNEVDIIHRESAVSNRESEAEKAIEEKNKLLTERLHYEGLSSELESRVKEVNKMKEEAQVALDNASSEKEKVSKILLEIKNTKSIIDSKEEKVNQKEQDLAKQRENLEKLRADVTPKIKEYEKLVSENSKILSGIESKNQEIKDNIKNENDLIVRISAEQNNLKLRQIEIKTREDALLRKEALNKR